MGFLKLRVQVALRCAIILVLCVAVSLTTVRAAEDGLKGQANRLAILNDNGAWSWFEGERVIYDATSGTLLLSSVANSLGAGGANRGGDVDVVSCNLQTREVHRFTLHDRLEEDDHDSAALLRLPDGRYLASYSKHAKDNQLRYRVSARPGDATEWLPEKSLTTAGGATYSNLCYLAQTKTIFNFHRDSGRGFDPNYAVWSFPKAKQFTYGGRLLAGPEGNTGRHDRPYVRYASDNRERIHFLVTDHHPRNLVSNSVYHGYIEAERTGYGVYNSAGDRLGGLSTNTTTPFKASSFTPLFQGDAVSKVNSLRMTRGWTTDIELDSAGQPYVAFSARVDDDDRDHRFFFGRHSSKGWQVHELAKAGGYLYQRENDYTGLVALDPNDPDHLFISTPIDPRTDETLAHYEIFEGFTSDQGKTWRWLPVTENSTVDNLRPIIPRGLQDQFVLVWMRGKYHTYTSYDLQIVGLISQSGAGQVGGVVGVNQPGADASR